MKVQKCNSAHAFYADFQKEKQNTKFLYYRDSFFTELSVNHEPKITFASAGLKGLLLDCVTSLQVGLPRTCCYSFSNDCPVFLQFHILHTVSIPDCRTLLRVFVFVCFCADNIQECLGSAVPKTVHFLWHCNLMTTFHVFLFPYRISKH